MSFHAVGPEEPKERSPKLVVQYRGTSSLFASDEQSYTILGVDDLLRQYHKL